MSIYDYLIAINVIAFLIYFIHVRLHHTSKVMKMIINLLSIAGGSIGVIASFLCFDRKAKKENMMIRVVACCMLLIQALVLLLWKKDATLNIGFLSFFLQHKVFLYYIGWMNLFTFVLFGLDKWQAKKGSRRIPIVTLLMFAALGGSLGGLVGMVIFHHKTRKDYFRIGMPLILITQVILILFIMNY